MSFSVLQVKGASVRFLLWLGCLALLAGLSAVPAARATQSVRNNWVQLVNGKDMAGWTLMNKGNWTVENGALKYTGGGNGWLRSNIQFTDFHVIAEWRYPVATGDHDSGFFFRAGLEGNPWPRGFQMNMGPGNSLGGVGGLDGAVSRPELLKKPGGEWNTYELIVVGDVATAIINGTKAWDAIGVGPGAGGYLGWQAEGTALEVKSVKVIRLTPSPGQP